VLYVFFWWKVKIDWKDTNLNKKILHDCEAARDKFKAFEFVYRVLRPSDLQYLREQSAAYKKAVVAVQALILPAVHKNCPQCPYGTCCRLQPDCRSLLCLQFFCEPLRRDLDMDLVNKRIAAVLSVIDNFSLERLFQKKLNGKENICKK
jgi:hypothetical protein